MLSGGKYDLTRGGVFQCHDRTHAIDIAHFNDDYCDCPDGSDEPGASVAHMHAPPWKETPPLSPPIVGRLTMHRFQAPQHVPTGGFTA